MSAWIVSKNHIDVLVTAALAWELTLQEQADETGRMLWKECQKSAAYRYPQDRDGELPGPWGLDEVRPGPPGITLADIEAYEFTPIEGIVDPEVVLLATRSLTHQSCEHPGWELSRARQFAGQLQYAAQCLLPAHRGQYGRVPEHELAHGGDQGAWAADSPRIFLAAAELRQAAAPQPH